MYEIISEQISEDLYRSILIGKNRIFGTVQARDAECRAGHRIQIAIKYLALRHREDAHSIHVQPDHCVVVVTLYIICVYICASNCFYHRVLNASRTHYR